MSLMRWTVPVDASYSFQFPFLLLAAVPVLAVLDVPRWILGVVLIASAVVLGGCGIVMAWGLAGTLRRGEEVHPEMVHFLEQSRRRPAAPASRV